VDDVRRAGVDIGLGFAAATFTGARTPSLDTRVVACGVAESPAREHAPICERSTDEFVVDNSAAPLSDARHRRMAMRKDELRSSLVPLGDGRIVNMSHVASIELFADAAAGGLLRLVNGHDAKLTTANAAEVERWLASHHLAGRTSK